MEIFDFQGNVVELSDEQIERLMRKGFDPNEVCKYHTEHGGVLCDKKKRKPLDCERCGWNPRVSRYRARRIRERMNEEGRSE